MKSAEKTNIHALTQYWRERAEHRAKAENGEAEQQDAPASEDIRDATHQRHGDDKAQQVRADDPGRVIKLGNRNIDAGISDDLWQGRHHHRLIHRGHKDAGAGHNQGRDGQTPLRGTGRFIRRGELFKRFGDARGPGSDGWYVGCQHRRGSLIRLNTRRGRVGRIVKVAFTQARGRLVVVF